MWRFAILIVVACGGGGGSKPVETTPIQNTQTPEAKETSERRAPEGMSEQRRALAEVDTANPRSLDHAVKAAEAIGEARDVNAIGELGAIAVRPPTKMTIALQIASIRALGRMDAAKAAAGEVLAKVITRDAPPRAKTREAEELYSMHLAVVGAAVNAMAELGETASVGALVPVLYRTPELSSQLRRAFAAIGAPAAVEMRKALRGEHAAVEAVLKASADPQQPTGAREFYAALVLGDLRDQSALQDLLDLLGKPALPAYYFDGEPAPVTNHSAAFDALRKLGAQAAAAKLEAIWKNPKADLVDRVGAIGAYAFCARNPPAATIDQLSAIALDNTADDGLRQEAAIAVGRLARDEKYVNPFRIMAKKYADASAKKRAAAAKLEPKKLKADQEFEDAKNVAEKAKAKLLATTQDRSTTAEQIKAATEVAKKAEADLKAAKKKHVEQISEWRANDAAAKAYVGYARLFQTHFARMYVAIDCKDDADCYVAALRKPVDEIAARVKRYVSDVDAWTVEEKTGLVEAYADRAMLELSKRGETKSLDTVLSELDNENRFVREAILLALPKIAPAKCAACVTKLDAALEAGRSKTYLASLQIETQVVRNYFSSR